MPYFAQNASVNANGVAKWRMQITIARSASPSPYPLLFATYKLFAKRTAAPGAARRHGVDDDAVLSGELVEPVVLLVARRPERRVRGAAEGAASAVSAAPPPRTATAAPNPDTNVRRVV